MKNPFSRKPLLLLIALALLTSCSPPPAPSPTPTPFEPGPQPFPSVTPGLPTTPPTETAQAPDPTPTHAVPLPTPETNFSAGQVAQSDAARIIAPNVSEGDIRTLTAGNTAFALDLYRRLKESGDNTFFSPHSISTALAMAYAGARGETAAEMAQTLHFTLPEERLHSAFNALDLALQPGAPRPDEQPLEIQTANALWAQHDAAFRPEFLDRLARDYGSGLRLVDYTRAPEPARLAINQWVSEQTKARIKDLIGPGLITNDTRLVLVNAVHFKGGWLHPFEAATTLDEPFTRLDGTQVSVPMMKWLSGETVNYHRGADYQIVNLPYQGGNAVLTLIVPDAGKFAAFEQVLTADQLADLLQSMAPLEVKVSLPKFHTESNFDLTDTLGQMGMKQALSGAADFSGMTGKPEFFIGAVIHKSFVDVDENGTEAAAATAVVMPGNAMPAPEGPIELKIDRPFIYLIRDSRTDAVLFMGRMVDPTQ